MSAVKVRSGKTRQIQRSVKSIFDPSGINGAEFKERLLRESGYRRGDGEEEGGDAERRVDGNEGGPEGGGGALATQQKEETEETDDKLEEEEAHGGESQPGVETVEVRDGGGPAVGRDAVLVVVPGGDEAHDDTGDSQEVEHGVEELGPDATTTPASAVHQHGFAHEVNEAGYHENRVHVPL